MIYLRNVHPRKTVLVPLSAGWARVLRPQVTTSLPEQALHTSAVRELLNRRMVEVADGAAWNADTRQARANRTDWSRLIAEAEQREFDMLLDRAPRSADTRRQRPKERKPRADEWPPESTARLRRRWAEGATPTTIASEMGVSPGAVRSRATRLGLPGRDWSRLR